MGFARMRDNFIVHFNEITKDVNAIFEVAVDKDEMWNLYLDSFPAGTNEIYRERREHDCSCCRHFVKSIGNVVVIKNNKVITVWDFDTESTTYQPVVDALAAYIKSKAVTNLFKSQFAKIGALKTFESLEDGIAFFEKLL